MRSFILATFIPLAACGNFGGGDDASPGIAASGSGGARTFAAADFTAVELRGPDDVDVRVGSGFSVRAEGDAKVLDKLKIERVGDTLRVGRVRGFGWGPGGHAKVYVTLPRMTEASLAGSGDMTVDRVEGATFGADIAGAGTLTVGTIAVDAAKLSIAGSGDLTVAGSATTFDASIAGAGDIRAGGLSARRASVSIAGSGSVRAVVEGTAKVSITGAGDVDLGPKARCETNKMGSGSVRCGA